VSVAAGEEVADEKEEEIDEVDPMLVVEEGGVLGKSSPMNLLRTDREVTSI